MKAELLDIGVVGLSEPILFIISAFVMDKVGRRIVNVFEVSGWVLASGCVTGLARDRKLVDVHTTGQRVCKMK